MPRPLGPRTTLSRPCCPCWPVPPRSPCRTSPAVPSAPRLTSAASSADSVSPPGPSPNASPRPVRPTLRSSARPGRPSNCVAWPGLRPGHARPARRHVRRLRSTPALSRRPGPGHGPQQPPAGLGTEPAGPGQPQRPVGLIPLPPDDQRTLPLLEERRRHSPRGSVHEFRQQMCTTSGGALPGRWSMFRRTGGASSSLLPAARK